jgi:MFS family permease
MGGMMANWSALQMQQVARGFLAYQVTGSFAALGLVELANTWPRLFLGLYGGVLADRASRRVIIQVGQAVNAFTTGIIAALLFSGELEFYHLLLGSFVQGVLNSFVLPARQAMIPEIVGPDRLMNAFALNVFVLNSMRLIAPAFAGGVIAVLMSQTDGDTFTSVGVIFAMMALMNVVAVLVLMRVPRTDAKTRARLRGEAVSEASGDRSGLQAIKEAFGYLKTEQIIIWLLIIQGTTGLLGVIYQRLLPGFVETRLGFSNDSSAAAMGMLLTLTAFGALLGALFVASLPGRNRGKLLAASLVLFGVTLIAFAASTVFLISLGIVFLLGIGQSVRQSIANILIQSRVEERFRGRISSIMLLDDGFESLGVFGIAIAADVLGAQWAFGVVGVCMIAYAAGIWLKRSIRELA